MQKRLWTSVLLRKPLGLPHHADIDVETTMRFCFSAEPLELPLYADACAETTMRFCFSANPWNCHMTQMPMQKLLCVCVIPRNPMQLPHDADAHAETTMRLCNSAQPHATAPQHRYLCRSCVSVFLLHPWNCPITQIPAQKRTMRFWFSA
jgi:hypothetical protein